MNPSHEDPQIHAFLAASPAVQAEYLRRRGLPVATLLPLMNACAQACFFCAGPGTSGRRDHSPTEAIWAQLSARPAGVERLLIGGNEPVLHPDFGRVMERAASFGYRRIDLMTNGQQLGKYARTWASQGLQEVVVPLYSLNPALHNEVCGADCFTTVWAGLLEAATCGIEVSVHSLLLRRTLSGLPDLAAQVQRQFGRRLAVGLLRPKSGFDWAAEAPSFAEIRASLQAIPEEYRPDLLVAPLCLQWGEGSGVQPSKAVRNVGTPALLSRLYFTSQARRFMDGCAGCEMRNGCEGVVEAYAGREG